MNYQEINDMRSVANELTTDINALIDTLHALTMGDGGVLHELKVLVGPDTGLGTNIGSLGTAVVQAGEAYRDNLNKMVNDMNERAATAESAAGEKRDEYQRQAANVRSFEWKTVK